MFTGKRILLFCILAIGAIVLVVQNSKEKELPKVELTNTIQTIDTFNAVEQAFVDTDTLVILDVDYTLLQPSNPAYQHKNFQLSPEFIKSCMKTLPESSKNEFATSIATSGGGQLLEESSPAIIESFKRNGARVLVISGLLVGQWNTIPDLLDWRISTLKGVGIIPSTFAIEGRVEFTDLPSYKGKYPEYKDGVILTNGELVKKQEVLESFFKKANWRPKKIVFIDDSRPIVEDMSQYAAKQNISFLGYEYKGAKKAVAGPITKEQLEEEWQRLKTGLMAKDG